jgi:hypothetical protein
MTFDSPIHQARSAQPELVADPFEIKPHAGPNTGKLSENQTPMTAAEKTLRDALLATKANGGIPNESAIDLFREAMTTSEKAIQQGKQFLKQNSKTAGEFFDSNQKLSSVQEQMFPDERKELADNMTAYLQGLVPKGNMEKAMQNHYGKDYPNLVPALKELYDASHAPNGAQVFQTINMIPRLVQDRGLTAKMYSAALDAEVNQRPLLSDLGIMRRLGTP